MRFPIIWKVILCFRNSSIEAYNKQQSVSRLTETIKASIFQSLPDAVALVRKIGKDIQAEQVTKLRLNTYNILCSERYDRESGIKFILDSLSYLLLEKAIFNVS